MSKDNKLLDNQPHHVPYFIINYTMAVIECADILTLYLYSSNSTSWST